MEWAKSKLVTNLALTGFEGGHVRALADVSLHVETAIGDYGVAEDAHSILCHFLSSQFKVIS
jgi:D-sedoheptulose 7-phosphate isomerase